MDHPTSPMSPASRNDSDGVPAQHCFTIISVLHDGQETGINGGKFYASSPDGAAYKVVHYVYKHLPKNDLTSIEIHIKEEKMNENQEHEVYSFMASRKLNDDPLPPHAIGSVHDIDIEAFIER